MAKAKISFGSFTAEMSEASAVLLAIKEALPRGFPRVEFKNDRPID